MVKAAIDIPQQQIADICQRNHITKMALFGSVLRDDFGPESDVDVLVGFDPKHIPGWAFFGMQDELAAIFQREVDLLTFTGISKYFRKKVLRERPRTSMSDHDDDITLRSEGKIISVLVRRTSRGATACDSLGLQSQEIGPNPTSRGATECVIRTHMPSLRDSWGLGYDFLGLKPKAIACRRSATRACVSHSSTKAFLPAFLRQTIKDLPLEAE